MTVDVDPTADAGACGNAAPIRISFGFAFGFCGTARSPPLYFNVKGNFKAVYKKPYKGIPKAYGKAHGKAVADSRDRDDTGVWRHTSLQLLVHSLLAARAECPRPVRHTSHVPLCTARHSAGSTDATRSFASHGAFGLRIRTLPSPMSNVARGSAPIICA
jgi:hypothetical protein